MHHQTFRALSLAILTAFAAGCTDTGDTSTPDNYAATIAAGGWATALGVSVSGDTITFTGDGIPDHAVLEKYAIANDGLVSVIGYTLNQEIPATPVYSATTTATNMGTIGVAISGAVYFSPYEGDGTTLAVDSNFYVDGFPFLDSCNAHPLPSGDNYHYHGIPYCITEEVDTAGEHSVLIGILLDGFGIYGPLGVDGAEPTDLDECSGHVSPTPEFPEGVYHYHFTDADPYSIDCFHGEVEVDTGGGPGGGPPQ